MTDQSPGRDGEDSVAALAIHLNTVRRDVESLTSNIDAIARTQGRHAVLLDGLAELRRQIDQILDMLTSQDGDFPATWFWLTMPEAERNKKFSELSDWVDTVLRTQYPDYFAAQVRPCWTNHPEARWELAWLYQLWTRAYLADHTTPRDAADWHDRWQPGVIRRLGEITRRCVGSCQLGPSN